MLRKTPKTQIISPNTRNNNKIWMQWHPYRTCVPLFCSLWHATLLLRGSCKCVLDNSVHDTTPQRLCANVTHRSIQPQWAVNTKDSRSESGSTGNLIIVSLKTECHYWVNNYYILYLSKDIIDSSWFLLISALFLVGWLHSHDHVTSERWPFTSV